MTRTVKVLAGLGVLFALAGCRCAPATPAPAPESTHTAEATAPAGGSGSSSAPDDGNEGRPIVDLANKAAAGADPDRAALLQAAHQATGIMDDLYVWQLYVQGTSAVGDVQGSTSAKRELVVFERADDGWKVVHHVRFIDASESALLSAAPAVTRELAEQVEFVVPVAVDPLFAKGAGPLIKNGKASGVSAMAVYAPTRLPEGFALVGSHFDEYSAEVRYAAGPKKLTYTIIVASDYGENQPRTVYSKLRFGDRTAFMDDRFDWGDGPGPGPHLMTAACGEHYLQGAGISPGIVAAVAESMVRVK